MKSDYKICPDCGHTHSTLVRHKCFKAPEQKDPPKFENPPEGEGEGEGEQQEGEGKGEGQPEEGEGEGQGQGGGQGEGEGDEESGEGEGGETEAEGEGQADVPPEPTAMEMVTLLRYASRTAGEATAFIKIEVAFKGLAIFAQNGDEFAEVVVPWEKLASQDTRSAEDAILEAVKDVDYKVSGGETEVPEDDGWIAWDGGDRPVSSGQRVEVWLRSYADDAGETNISAAGWYTWEHDGHGGDIIRYRLID